MKIRDYGILMATGSSRLNVLARAAIVMMVALVLGCGARTGEASALYAEAARDDPRTHPFVIGPSDVIQITVWKDPSLSTEATVRPDGTITLPLVGEVVAAGRTALQLKAAIKKALEAFTKTSVVTVSVIEVNSYRFTVSGNVQKPGMYTPKYYVTVSEAIALAGGPNRYASTGDVVVVRAKHRIPIDYDAILDGKSPEQDFAIRAGDAIQVP